MMYLNQILGLVIVGLLAAVVVGLALIRKGRRAAGYLVLTLAALACGGLIVAAMVMVQDLARNLGNGLGEFTAPPTCPVILSNEQIAVHRDKILSLPVIRQLTQLDEPTPFYLPTCAQSDQLQGYLSFTLPAQSSRFGVVYQTRRDFSFTQDNPDQIVFTWGSVPLELDYSSIMAYLTARIRQYESVPAIQEYLTYQKPVTTTLATDQIRYITLSSKARPVSYRGNINSAMTYSIGGAYISEYDLPNAIQWTSLPEIRQAQEIIRQHLLTGKLAQCQIGMDELFNTYSYTVYVGRPVYRGMRVDLHCPDKVRVAELQLYMDGHFENLKIFGDGD